MERIIMKSFLSVLILTIYGMSTVCFAQNTDNDEASLQGKWIFEDITAFEGNVQQPFSLDDLCCELPREMDIQQDGIVCIWKEGSDTANYDFVIRGNSMCFSFCAEWQIADNKLLLKWTYDVESETPSVFNMTVTYKFN